MSEPISESTTLEERQRNLTDQIVDAANFDPTSEVSWALYQYSVPDVNPEDGYIEHEVAVIIDRTISLDETDPPLLRVMDQAPAGPYFFGDVLVRDISLLGALFAQYHFGLYEKGDPEGLNGVTPRFWYHPQKNRLEMSDTHGITMPSEVEFAYPTPTGPASSVITPFGKYEDPGSEEYQQYLVDKDYAVKAAQKIIDIITKEGHLIDFSGRTR